jgi:hypothetical protein
MSALLRKRRSRFGPALGALALARGCKGLRCTLSSTGCRLNRNLNNIGVRSFILTGAPFFSLHDDYFLENK